MNRDTFQVLSVTTALIRPGENVALALRNPPVKASLPALLGRLDPMGKRGQNIVLDEIAVTHGSLLLGCLSLGYGTHQHYPNSKLLHYPAASKPLLRV